MKKYFRNKEKTSWYGFEPADKTGLIEITEEEWNKHLEDIKPKKTEVNEKQQKLAQLKSKLASYDYIGIKIATGCATLKEYASQIAEAERLREQIRELEK